MSDKSDKKKYRVAEGVDWVNGAKVPDNHRVELTEGEALYDLALGRIEKLGSASKPKASEVVTPPVVD